MSWNKIHDMKAYLEERSMPEPNSGCWLWLGSINRLGYGQTAYFNGVTKAHRLSWLTHRGTIPDRMMVLHKCDVRQCINPDHLFLGTQTDNMRDMARKGRGKSIPQLGAKNPMARLSEGAASQILARYRAGGVSQHALAADYGVAVMTINRLVRGLTWKHLQN